MLKALRQISNNNETRILETFLFILFGAFGAGYLVLVLDTYVRGVMLISAGKLITG